jgi:ADP-ribose pyrophosphatase YjhB (NUDIX family)
VRDAPRIVHALLEHAVALVLGSYKRSIGAGALVRDRDGRLLLVRTGYRPGWSLPGGHVGRRESLEVGLRREVHEETGFDVEVGPLLLVDAREPRTIVFLFAAEVTGGTADLAPLEIRALRWVPETEIATVLELDRSRLRHALAAQREGRTHYLAAPTIHR